MTLVIEDAHDLDRTAQLASWFARPAVGQVHVRLPWLDHGERMRSASALARLFNECGSLWAAPAFLSVLAWGALGAPWSAWGTVAAMAISLLLATVGGPGGDRSRPGLEPLAAAGAAGPAGPRPGDRAARGLTRAGRAAAPRVTPGGGCAVGCVGW